MKITDQIVEALRSGEGELACKRLNTALRAYNKSLALADKCECSRNPFEARFGSLWDFLGISEDDLAREAFDAWDGSALAVLSDNFRALKRDWSFCFLPTGEIHFDPEPEIEGFRLIPWRSTEDDSFEKSYDLDPDSTSSHYQSVLRVRRALGIEAL